MFAKNVLRKSNYHVAGTQHRFTTMWRMMEVDVDANRPTDRQAPTVC